MFSESTVLHPIEHARKWRTVGSSREPLPATRFGRLSLWKEYNGVLRHLPKRLPCYGVCQATEDM